MQAMRKEMKTNKMFTKSNWENIVSCCEGVGWHNMMEQGGEKNVHQDTTSS
jgi:hypothetical protein